MTKVDEALESVLQGYASFLRDRMLATLNHQPYMVWWVQEFLVKATGGLHDAVHALVRLSIRTRYQAEHPMNT